MRAAAKVAFGAAFIGALPSCGGKVETSGGSAPISDPPANLGVGGNGPTRDSPATVTSSVAGRRAMVEPQPVADAAAPDAAAPNSAPPDSGLQCLGEVVLRDYPAQSTPVSAAEFACCVAYGIAHSTDLADAGQATTHGSEPSLVNCCKAIIAGTDQGALRTTLNAPVAEACCWNGIVAPREQLWDHGLCSPWGPPVPPALAFELEAVA